MGPSVLGTCPYCKAAKYTRNRCAECPIDKLEESLSGVNGAVLRRARRVEYYLRRGYHITPQDVDALTEMAVRIIEIERSRYKPANAE